MRLTTGAMLGVVLGLSVSPVSADEPGVSPAELDQKARKVAYDIVSLGADLFNSGNQEGCYRLYEGTLIALKPMLSHRAELARLIQDRLDRARTARSIQDKAFALREALDEIMKEPGKGGANGKSPPMKTVITVGKKPLWERLGGEKGVRAVTRDFLAAAAKDPKANIDRNGNYPLTKERAERVEQLVVEFVSSVTGGPLKYTGRDMKNSHTGMKITQEEFNAAAGHLIAALKKNGVGQEEIDELVKLVSGVANDIIEVKK